MMVFENEFPASASGRQICTELYLNLTESFFDLLDLWKINRCEPGR